MNQNTPTHTKFHQFDVVSDFTDHHFASKPTSSGLGKTQKVKKIMQEWKLLDKNLPESIFVRVSERKVELLRAAIVGARGTPYHDGLFFFDVYFPMEYPYKPPLVQYKSFGLRVNPNLYANGKVCLSLLNTWTGKRSERWDPLHSNILQVLLSIQALVLNEKPYFNEPGIGSLSGQRYWEKKSSAYNEDVFILTCKTMIHLLQRPPKQFGPLVNEHFKNQAHFILSASDGYRKGLVKIGQFNGVHNRCPKPLISRKFKGLMDRVYGQLVEELAKSGASVGDFVEKLEEEREKAAKEVKATKTERMNKRECGNGVGKNLLKKLKNFLFLKLKNNKKSKTVSDPVVCPAV